MNDPASRAGVQERERPGRQSRPVATPRRDIAVLFTSTCGGFAVSSSPRACATVNAPRTPHPTGTISEAACDVVVVAAIEGYRPKSLKELRRWDAIAALVREVVAGSGPPSRRRAIELMRTVAHFASWAAGEGVPAQVESLFRPEHVERYIATGCPQLSEGSRATRRSALRRMGRAATRTAPWVPPPAQLPRQTLADPYSPVEVAGFWAAAQAQRTPALRRTATALLTLGLGAGLVPIEHFGVHGRHVQQVDGVTVVQVDGRRARQVPVLEVYAEPLRDLAAEVGEALLIGHPLLAGQESRQWHVIRLLDLPAGLPVLRAGRLRSTWLVSLLALRVQVDELLEAAGIATTRPLQDLTRFVPRRGDLTRLRAVAGLPERVAAAAG